MTEIQNIEHDLARLTEWDGEETSLWRSALEKTPRAARSNVNSIIAMIGSRGFLRVAAVVVVVMTIGVAMLPNIERANPGAPAISSDMALSHSLRGEDAETFTNIRNPVAGGGADSFPSSQPSRINTYYNRAAETSFTRSIIRKATIELRVEDVRATFFLIPSVLNDSLGEYIQESSIRGDGELASAEIILRVGSTRLEEAMNELRGLGEVTGEQIRGEDVTNRIVDLDAQLRNAQRVEQEMLQLLESRDDAPLKEILDLQRAIGDVRLKIEQMTAQRDNLNALAELATIRVSIRAAKSEEPADDDDSLGAYFVDQIAGAWQSGTRTLVNAAAFIVRGFIGGLLWWAILLVVIGAGYRWLYRRAA